jgi:hypothetical protein
VLASWFASQAYVTQRELHNIQTKIQSIDVPSHGGGQTVEPTQANRPGPVPGNVAAPGGESLLVRNPGVSREVSLIQDRERLQLEIQKMKSAHASLTQPQEGVLQMKLVALRSPDKQPGAATSAHQLLDRITEAVSATLPKTETPAPKPATEKPTDSVPQTPPASAPKQPKVSAHGVGADQELEISGPVNLKALNLAPDQRVVYRDGFTAGDYQELTDGVWWDENRNFVWRKQTDGSVIGQQPPAQWTPESEAPPLRVPTPETAVTPSVEPPSTTPPATPVAPATPTAPLESWTFVDGPRGDGTIIVQNMPAPSSGQIHALWSQETATSQPVFRGYFPDLPNGNGVISFSLPPGTPPATFMVTAEPASANPAPASPSNNVILIGP